ncbi:Crp/Fnr family transcriptional regulator [Vibrio splendidus]|uniref:Crp/Fnr family transcriptional regulator n=1 Tax=Vibrio splendidus TaxID=29497 RepID=UPI000D38D8B5|nr:Crp/Fnr family transcriptional regulator [Vibrio splendidus]PTP42124.1 Crp/Fnr family transcriptional regulator [Vibrio splendidus]
MHTSFIEQLQSFDFSESQIESLLAVAKPLELPTRHILINQGEMASSIYFVLEGESLIKNQASPYLLETLTPITMLELPMNAVIEWRASNNPLYLKLLETQLMHKENKERFMLLYTPEQRYQLFCEHYPDLEQRLNDNQIAAYLGITAISLSRIKGRINNS